MLVDNKKSVIYHGEFEKEVTLHLPNMEEQEYYKLHTYRYKDKPRIPQEFSSKT